MRRRTREYNYDWMQLAIYGIGRTLFNGTPKEIEATIRLLPTFDAVLKTITKTGEMGRLFLVAIEDYMDRIVHAHERGDKLALFTFLGSNILVDAFDGLQGVCAELLTGLAGLAFRQGNYEYFDYGCELGLTETSCTAQRGLIGAFLAGLMAAGKPDICIAGSSGPCDTNANALQFYADHAGIPLIALDTPPVLVDDRVEDFQVRDLENMIAEVEKLTGARFNEDKLRALLIENQKQNLLLNELYELTRLVPNPIPAIATLYVMGTRIMKAGSKFFTDLCEEVLRVARQNAREGKAGTYSGEEKARLYMCYIDHFTINAQFYEWAMANDISLLINIVMVFWAQGVSYSKGFEDECYNTDTSNRKAMLRTLANLNGHLPMNKQMRGPWDAKAQWLSEIKTLAKIMKPDYIMYNGTLGCRNSWSVNKLVQREMENLGYPFMVTFADAFDERPNSWENAKKQMEEFMSVRGKAS